MENTIDAEYLEVVDDYFTQNEDARVRFHIFMHVT
jgi:hypothetical protein